ERVYNFEVEGYHSYYADGIYVHNDYELPKLIADKLDDLKLNKELKEAFELQYNAQESFRDAIAGNSKVVDAWLKLHDTVLKTNTYWLGRISRWEKSGLFFDYVKDGLNVKVFRGSNEIAELSEKLFTFKYSGFGGDIKCPLDKTTTLIGLYGDKSKKIGTSYFIDIGLYKNNLSPNNNPGGINVLNIIGWTWKKNKEWLENAIKRGDAIRIISDPSHPRTIWKNGIPPGKKGFNGKKTVTAKEIYILEKHGYSFDSTTSTYIPNSK
ncbi:hypothetical protein, partial [Flammeovirga aprica]